MNKRRLPLNRRSFAAGLVSAGGALMLPYGEAAGSNAGDESPEEFVPFSPELAFERHPFPTKAEPSSPSQVKLLGGVFRESAEANLRYLKRLDADRLLHNFRVNAGLPSSAQPLGGWEKPDCELRGHFVGHYLSACALAHASGSDAAIKQKADYMVAEMARCQQQLSKTWPGYLSAFPMSLFDRLDARTKVWAPFYTVHKIMAGLFDMHTLTANPRALEVLEAMATWTDNWTASKSEAHMQDILNTEYGGMNDILYKLSALTGNNHYAVVGDRFTKKKFFNPLALRRDQLRGLHANTHIPQVIGAAQRYQISSDSRFRNVAEFFWSEITEARSYVTGGNSNGEHWLVEPGQLNKELKQSVDTTEDCCAYNMLKLTRHLYEWTADPRYFDYYERTLLNHRIPAIDRSTGATQYYLSIFPNAWKTFNTPNDSFWCCTGTGVEEFAKLNQNIYFHDAEGLYVNLFIPSELRWAEQGLTLRQETSFPESDTTTLIITDAPADAVPIHLRIPAWAGNRASVLMNDHLFEVTPSAGSYYTLARKWNAGDQVTLRMPMRLHMESIPGDSQTVALLYGPLVLAGQLGSAGLTGATTIGPEGPGLKPADFQLPVLRASSADLESAVRPIDKKPLTFHASSESGDVTLLPFYQTFDTRYSVYWRLA